MSKNNFMSNKEYAKSFTHFWGLRRKIARTLIPYGLKADSKILDILAGHGFYSYEIAKIIEKGKIISIGLSNDVESFQRVKQSKTRRKHQKLLDLIDYRLMDATKIEYPENSFDFVVNFLGLEDVNMTKGIDGVKEALKECSRVLKPSGILQITLCLEGNDPDQIIAKEVTEAIGHQAIFYPKEFYIDELKRNNIEIIKEKWFYTKRKMTQKQAKEELIFACEETPKYFKDYKINTMTFEELWDKYGERIKKYGLAFYSQLLVLIGQKQSLN